MTSRGGEAGGSICRTLCTIFITLGKSIVISKYRRFFKVYAYNSTMHSARMRQNKGMYIKHLRIVAYGGKEREKE